MRRDRGAAAGAAAGASPRPRQPDGPRRGPGADEAERPPHAETGATVPPPCGPGTGGPVTRDPHPCWTATRPPRAPGSARPPGSQVTASSLPSRACSGPRPRPHPILTPSPPAPPHADTAPPCPGSGCTPALVSVTDVSTAAPLFVPVTTLCPRRSGPHSASLAHGTGPSEQRGPDGCWPDRA